MKTLMGTKSTLNTTTKFKKVSRKQYLNCLLINQGKIKSNKFQYFSCHSLLGRQHYYSARMWGLKSSMEFRDGRIKNWTKNCLHWWTDFFVCTSIHYTASLMGIPCGAQKMSSIFGRKIEYLKIPIMVWLEGKQLLLRDNFLETSKNFPISISHRNVTLHMVYLRVS